MEKKISCGFLICSKQGFLAVHPTGRKKEFGCYDIPKGCNYGMESYYKTAKRELMEETGLDLDYIKQFTDVNVVDLGINKYQKEKDLVLYVAEIPNIDKFFNFQCTSFFEDKNGMETPEVDGYIWTKDLNYYFKSLRKTFRKLHSSNNTFCSILHKYGNFETIINFMKNDEC